MTNSIDVTLYNNYEKGDEMYYELYVDSFILVNFCMNLYLLLLINERTHRTATRLRLLLGAAAGALLFLLPFFYQGPGWARILFGVVPGAGVMLLCAFRIRSVSAFIRMFRLLLFYSLLFGGGLLFVLRCAVRVLPQFGEYLTGIFGMMGAGAAVFLLLFYRREREESGLCAATLVRGEKSVRVTALIDSGNRLTEPVSGKPVSVLDREVFDRLWEGEDTYYRAVPYHSVGKDRGILRGYFLPEIRLELDGVIKICREVCVAVEEQGAFGRRGGEREVKLILNPLLIGAEKETRVKKRKSEVSE